METTETTSRRALRTQQLHEWVAGHLPHFFLRRTAANIAGIASHLLGWEVSPHRMARVLYAHNIRFRAADTDPQKPRQSRLDYLEARLVKLEKDYLRLCDNVAAILNLK